MRPEAEGAVPAQRDGAEKLDATGGVRAGVGEGCVTWCGGAEKWTPGGGFSEGWDAPLPGRATAVATASLGWARSPEGFEDDMMRAPRPCG